MVRKLKLVFAPSAVKDVEAWVEYMEEQGAPETGRRWAKKLFEAAGRLTSHPASGRIVPELSKSDFREVIHPPFRLVYRVQADTVQVIRIWRSERTLKIPKVGS